MMGRTLAPAGAVMKNVAMTRLKKCVTVPPSERLGTYRCPEWKRVYEKTEQERKGEVDRDHYDCGAPTEDCVQKRQRSCADTCACKRELLTLS